MERLDVGSNAPLDLSRWLENRWMIPVLSFGLAAFCLSIILSPSESLAPMDALFLVNAKNHEVGQWVLPPDPRTEENLLPFSTEEK